MAFSTVILVNNFGANVGNIFSIYSDVDNYTTPFVTGITRTQLINGYVETNVPDGTQVIKLSNDNPFCDLQPIEGIAIGSLPCIYMETSNISTTWGPNAVTKTGATLDWIVYGAVNYNSTGNTPTFNFSTVGKKYIIVYSSDNLEGLDYFQIERISYIDVSTARNLKSLNVSDDDTNRTLTGCTLGNNTELETLDISGTNIGLLDLSNANLKSLTMLDVGTFSRPFSGVTNFAGQTRLEEFYYLGPGAFDQFDPPLTFDFTNLNNIKHIEMNGGQLNSNSVLSNKTGLTYADVTSFFIDTLNISNCPNLEYVRAANHVDFYSFIAQNNGANVTGGTVNGRVAPYYSVFDMGNDYGANIFNINGSNIKSLEAYSNGLNNTNFNPNVFTDLVYLDLSFNGYLSLNISNLTNLTGLTLESNYGSSVIKLSSLSLPIAPLLTYVRLNDNQLTGITISNITGVTYLNIEANNFSTQTLNSIINNLVTYGNAGTYFNSSGQIPCSSPYSQFVDNLDAIWGTVLVDSNCNSIPINTTGLTLYINSTDTTSYPTTGTTVIDLTTNGNNGTLQNGVIFTGTTPSYFRTDGVNDDISFPSYYQPVSSNRSYTVSGWFQSNTGSTEYDLISSNNMRLYVTSGNTYAVSVTTTGGTVSVIGSTQILPNHWNYLTFKWTNGSNLSIYIDGVLDGTTSTSNLLVTAPSYWKLAGSGSTLNIGEFDVYDIAVSDSVIVNNYDSNKYTFINRELSYNYQIITNISTGQTTTQASNLKIDVNNVTYGPNQFSFISDRNETYTFTNSSVTGGTVPIVIYRNLRNSNATTSYTNYITGYTASIFVNNLQVWTTGATYFKQITNLTTDVQVIPASIPIKPADSIRVVYSDNEMIRITPTPTPTPTPTATPTPTPTPVSFTLQYRYNGYNAVDGTKTVSNLKIVLNSTDYTFSNRTFTTSTNTTQSQTVSIQPGTYGVDMFRNICSTLAGDVITNRTFRLLKNGSTIFTSSNTANLTMTVCPSQISQNVSLGSVTIAAGDTIQGYWEDELI